MNDMELEKREQSKIQTNDLITGADFTLASSYHCSFRTLYCAHMSSNCQMVAATRITVLLESSVEQQEIKEMGPMEATSKKHGTGYVLVSKKENIWLSSYYSSISSVVRSPRASSADAGRGWWRDTRR